MTVRAPRHRTLVPLLLLACLLGSPFLAIPGGAATAQTPQRGGVLLAVIGAAPPSLDPHQEQTFAVLQPVAPLYSTLLQIDPLNYPKIIGDIAREWTISPDGLTYTFKLHPGIKFHDGSLLTAADVKASYDKIVFPPQGVRSIRKHWYLAVASVEAPEPSTVVFKLKFPSASLLSNLASPWNVVYPKKYLDQDPNYFKKNVVGSGPFKLKGYTPGSTFEGERNSDYFVKDRPYLDGYKFFVSTETSVRAAAIRSGRAYIEFRNLPQTEAEAIKKQLGDKVVVQSTAYIIQFASRPREVPGLLAGRREEPGGGEEAAGRGRVSQRFQGGAQEPQRQAPLPGFRGLRDPGVEEDRDRGRAPAAGDRVLVRGRA
jgi:peptide/nickel transport system substrate-binding protein